MSYRTPTPEDAYLTLLGRAVYTWAYVEWTMIYLGHWLDGTPVADLADRLPRKLVQRVQEALTASGRTGEEVDHAAAALVELERLGVRRNDIIHARPATARHGGQRLHRSSQKRQTELTTVEAEDLDSFVHAVEAVGAGLSPLFELLRRERP